MASEKNLIISADFGTGSVKVALLGTDGEIAGRASGTYETLHPVRDGAEQRPQDWWGAFAETVKRAASGVADYEKRVAGIVFCAQMCGLVCTDAAGEPLRPCLIWRDKRAAGLTRRYVGGFPTVLGYNAFKGLRWLYLGNGAPAVSGTEAPGKILWLRENEPDVWARTEHILDMRDWLVMRATGERITTADCASLTWMFDSRKHRCDWSPALMRSLGVTREQLPRVTDAGDVAGTLTERAAGELGLPMETPVFAGSGDVFAAALGAGAHENGELHIYLGTSSWIGGFFNWRRLNPFLRYATITGPVERRPLLIATQESAGACIEWISDLVQQSSDDAALSIPQLIDEALATDVESPLFLPWLAGERTPVDDNRLRGAFLGLTLDDDRSRLVRGVLEGIALNTRWTFSWVNREPGVRRDRPVRLAGGLAAHHGFCQMLSDCLGREISVGDDPGFAGVRGAARVAAAGLGWIETPWESDGNGTSKSQTVFAPNAERHAYFNERMSDFRYAYRRTAPLFRRQAARHNQVLDRRPAVEPNSLEDGGNARRTVQPSD